MFNIFPSSKDSELENEIRFIYCWPCLTIQEILSRCYHEKDQEFGPKDEEIRSLVLIFSNTIINNGSMAILLIHMTLIMSERTLGNSILLSLMVVELKVAEEKLQRQNDQRHRDDLLSITLYAICQLILSPCIALAPWKLFVYSIADACWVFLLDLQSCIIYKMILVKCLIMLIGLLSFKNYGRKMVTALSQP